MDLMDDELKIDKAIWVCGCGAKNYDGLEPLTELICGERESVTLICHGCERSLMVTMDGERVLGLSEDKKKTRPDNDMGSCG